MKRIVIICLLPFVIAGCQTESRKTTNSQVVEGILEYHKPGDKDIQSWYGHIFVVRGTPSTPILPSKNTPEEKLKAFIGKKVRVTGQWNPGIERQMSKKELMCQIPAAAAETGSARTGDGLVTETIQELK